VAATSQLMDAGGDSDAHGVRFGGGDESPGGVGDKVKRGIAMRSIKFRVWNPLDKKMFYDVQNAFHSEYGNYVDEDGDSIYTDAHGFNEVLGFVKRGYLILMQFTGLLDKNGKEIWEGDIVNLWNGSDIDGRGFFVWDKECAGFVHTWEEWFDGKPSGQFRPHKRLWLSQQPKIVLEVIGNIYENPKLLDGGK